MDLYSLGIGVLFIAGTVAVALSCYAISRRIAGDPEDQRTRDLAGSVLFRVAALHGLILALVFAEELADHHALHGSLVQEASAVADIYYDIERYGAPQAIQEVVRGALSDYVRIVLTEEWPLLATDSRLSQAAWDARERAYLAILDLAPSNRRQEDLRAHMLDNVQKIAALRVARDVSARHHINPLFWLAAVVGLVFVTIPYFVFPPNWRNLVLLSVYGGFSGLIMFIIFAMADPFAKPAQVQPTALERLLERGIGTTN
ncbi:MAG: hypothetical protein AAF674_00455 [Pseudomonadota bacterium]